MLISFVAAGLSFWNYNHFDNFMVTRLYKLYKPNKDGRSRSKSNTFQESEFLEPPLMINTKEYIKDLLPSCLACCSGKKTCCGPNRVDRAFAKAREKIAEETNIIEIVKSRRYQAAALKFLLTKEQRIKLKNQTRYFAVDPDSEEKPEKKQVQKIDDSTQKDLNWTEGFYSSSSQGSEEFDFEKNDFVKPTSGVTIV